MRGHPDLGPAGANVDFVTAVDRGTLDVRCYERGVEAETLSSGTGYVASALVARRLGRVGSEVACRSRAGLTGSVRLEDSEDGRIAAVLSGDARVIYNAVLNTEALTGWKA
jgi:diaminopimelate epimerase